VLFIIQDDVCSIRWTADSVMISRDMDTFVKEL
jgi:hypothetical protein